MFGPADKKLGFGFMRLPMKGEEGDIETTCRMVDEFLAAGFCYFDTAHGYHDGQSEAALKAALTSRYPREKYILADKLSPPFFEKEADIRPLFEQQLEACGVEYFDMYLMHAQSAGRFEFYKSCRAYETAFALKAEGRVRHVGISFHDTAEVLERILTEYPQLDFVQLQFNYLDYEDPQVQSRACYEVCRRHHKPVVVMEPVRGGRLARLPDEARALLQEVSGSSPAAFALRFAADFEGVKMVLSGMSSLEQMEENLRVMSAPRPFPAQSGRRRSRCGASSPPSSWCSAPPAATASPAARRPSASRTALRPATHACGARRMPPRATRRCPAVRPRPVWAAAPVKRPAPRSCPSASCWRWRRGSLNGKKAGEGPVGIDRALLLFL